MDRLYNDVNVYKQRLFFTYAMYKTCSVILCQLHQRKNMKKKIHSDILLMRTCYQ